ncbi:MAG: periplasmic heavy metal sensor [Stellaceae bacterium]
MTDVPGARPPRRRWAIIALVISLIVNLFLIGGIAGTISLVHARFGPPGPLERAARHLNLSPTQNADLNQLETMMHRRGRNMHHAEHRIWMALADPKIGTDKVNQLLQQGLANKTGFETYMSAAFGRFLGALTPAQRTEFITRLEAFHRHRGPLHLFARLFR